MWELAETRYGDFSQAIPTDFTIPRYKVTRKDAGNGKYQWQIWWNNQELYNKVHSFTNPNQIRYEHSDGYQYRAGAYTTEGQQQPGIYRYECAAGQSF